MSALWDPLDVCAISELLQYLTCIRVTKSRRSCGLIVSQEARLKANSKLETLGRITPNSDEVKAWLLKIAGLLLCKQWHQNQGLSIARQWQEAVRNLAPLELTMPHGRAQIPRTLGDHTPDVTAGSSEHPYH
ncbi:hypothetical protein BJY01DRAFT_255756 [Aspergillus pseudoustus]|uniref:Uncharacterized protein n=1 Tax=Aspergillus pseudoustus TaxID=1810923 RepID=A0ABR4IHN9_9EURO